MKERLLKLVFVSLGLIFFVGCEKGPDDDEIFEQRKDEYARWIDDRICRQVVDNLDFLFWASAHRDSLLCGGDTEAVIKRQFSNPSLPAPKFNELGEICEWKYIATHTMQHNGISLSEDGAEWTAYGKMKRFRNASQQPVEIDCRWTIKRANGVYTLTGGMIHNGLQQEYFPLSSFSNVEFTITSDIVTVAIVNGVREERRHISYCFDGGIALKIIKDAAEVSSQKPCINLVLDGVAGRNTKNYVQGIPVFGREDYFNDGKVDVSVADAEAPWKFIIYYTKYGARY